MNVNGGDSMRSFLLGKTAALVMALVTAFALGACGPSQNQPGFAQPPGSRVGEAPTVRGQGPTPIRFPAPDHQAGTAPAAPAGPPPAPPAGADSVPKPADPARDLCVGPDGQNFRAPGSPNPAGVICAKCATTEVQLKNAGRKKLDMFFIADTSPSLKSTRRKIADNIASYVQNLPQQTDYNIAVLPAHSDEGFPGRQSSGLGGKIWAPRGQTAVLRSSQYRDRNDPNKVDMTRLATDLRARLLDMPMDFATDGGEAGLLSLSLAVTKYFELNRGEASNPRIFRDDAIWSFIAVSDENDLCAKDYYPPAEGESEAVRNKEKVAANDPRNIEHAAHQHYCSGANGRPAITPESVLAQIQQVHPKEKTMMSAIVYHPKTGGLPIPAAPSEPAASDKSREAQDLRQSLKWWFEKDDGHGYVEMVQAMNGQIADLAKERFDEGLSQIGLAAAELLVSSSDPYVLDNVDRIDPGALCLSVDDRQEIPRVEAFNAGQPGISYVFDERTRTLQLRGVGPAQAGRIKATYCEPPNYGFVSNDDQVSRPENQELTRGSHYGEIAKIFRARGCTQTLQRLQSSGAANR